MAQYPGIDPRLESSLLKTAVNTSIFQVTFLPALLTASLCFWKLSQILTRPVNKLVLVAARCQFDPYVKEIIVLHAIRL